MDEPAAFPTPGRVRYWLFLPALLLLLIWQSGAFAATLAINISGVRDTQGKVAVALFSSAAGFPKDDSKAIRRIMLPIDAASHSARIVLSDIVPGSYAIAAFHDDNNSGKLETNFFGVPKKGYGFSNNPKPRMRPATYDEARFVVPAAGASVSIQLVY
ncbi:DUF2141 domain-containing protein [Paralcaligenes ureilyticus]|uniref:Uncharacterized protein (DUF2141 family) n=1 Tax=Paralcaligenes ureilyticus TaxID=627131 RepID=A0A4R3M5I8_9BURK|nr:DUF2141 domain-containing protein [Paralcaligenes ureilyticus]TCT08634.1 uncharacterized protein (DUF2141 family) [Paralcaligenes ureilyticus]